MATPTNYDLEYDNPCVVEDGCEVEQCPDQIKFTARPQVFCKEVDMLSTLTVVPPEITVGGQTFKPTVIETISGPHLVLAVY